MKVSILIELLTQPHAPPRAGTASGKHDQLVGKIQERYGIARDAAQKQVDEWKAVESHESDLEQRR